MNKYTIITVIALLALVIILPVYAILEPSRMEQSQEELRQEFVDDAAVMYIENCAICHGAAGEGIGSMPPLNTAVLQQADYDFLYKTIERGRYDTAMTGWHTEEGGIYNEYQIDELVALIRYGDWPEVGEIAAAQGMIPASLPVPDVEEGLLAEIIALAPEGSEWAAGIQVYANNCTICHGVDGAGSELGVPLNAPELRATEATELIRIVTEGAPATMMAGWDNALSTEEIAQVVAFLQNWDTISANELALTAPQPIQIDLNNPEEVAALGERIFSTTCVSCHGEEGSGGTGPALNSQQFLTSKTNRQIIDTIISGGHRPGSIMPAFGDRLTMVEIEALTDYIRAWEPTAPYVENPRGTEQGGGPPWLRPDADGTISPNGDNGQGGGKGQGGNGQGGPPWRTDENSLPPGQSGDAHNDGATGDQAATLSFIGEVVIANENNLIFIDDATAEMHEAMLGPPFFWSESGIPLNPGDQIRLEGFESPDHMELNWIENLTTGQRVDLRTPDGMPVWNN